MAFTQAKKEKIWLKILMAGPSGSGKSYSALRVAKGIAEQTGGKIAAVDTENGRIRYYADEFDFDDMQIADYSPETYINAINEAVAAGYNVLIIDSMSHEWSYILEQVDKMPGSNSYTKWGKLTPRHDAFKEKILQSPIHIIATVRGKDAYVLEQDSKGKQIPKKVGLGYSQRDGLEYEYTVTFNIDQANHVAQATKDNTHLFENVYNMLTEEDGVKLYNWANAGETPIKTIQQDIITLATTLGGSQNSEVVAATIDILGVPNPMNCNDRTLLEKSLKALKKISKKGGK